MIDEIKGIFQTAIDIHTPPSTADGDAASSSAAGGVWPGPELQRRDIVSRARHALKVIDMQAVEYFADFMSAGTMRELAGVSTAGTPPLYDAAERSACYCWWIAAPHPTMLVMQVLSARRLGATC